MGSLLFGAFFFLLGGVVGAGGTIYKHFTGPPVRAVIEQCDDDQRVPDCFGRWERGDRTYQGEICCSDTSDLRLGDTVNARVHGDTAYVADWQTRLWAIFWMIAPTTVWFGSVLLHVVPYLKARRSPPPYRGPLPTQPWPPPGYPQPASGQAHPPANSHPFASRQ